MEHSHEELCAILNEQTGKLHWPDLEKHFARGVVIKVAEDMDLIEVAAAVVEDNKKLIENWMASSLVSNADDKDAKKWIKNQPEFWTVVVAPWVVIKEIN